MIEFIIGFFSGIIGGMGIGGGTILIPALYIFLSTEQHIAQSVNLISFLPMAVAALILHYKNGNLVFKIIIIMTIGGIFGSLIGSYLALILASKILKKMFAVFLLIMGIYEILYKKKDNNENKEKQTEKDKKNIQNKK